LAPRTGISAVIAEVIIVAVAIAISVAVAGWLMGLWGGVTSQEVYYHYFLIINTPSDKAYQPIPGVATIEVWSEPSGGDYKVYIRVTALKNLAYIHVKATITNRTGGPPTYVGAQYSSVEWEDDNIPAGWYSERYWTPITSGDYPIKIDIHLFVRES